MTEPTVTCVCSNPRVMIWQRADQKEWRLFCMSCDRETHKLKTRAGALAAWNRLMEKTSKQLQLRRVVKP